MLAVGKICFGLADINDDAAFFKSSHGSCDYLVLPVLEFVIDNVAFKGLYFLDDKENAVVQWKKSLEMGNKSQVLPEKINKIIYIESPEEP